MYEQSRMGSKTVLVFEALEMTRNVVPELSADFVQLLFVIYIHLTFTCASLSQDSHLIFIQLGRQTLADFRLLRTIPQIILLLGPDRTGPDRTGLQLYHREREQPPQMLGVLSVGGRTILANYFNQMVLRFKPQRQEGLDVTDLHLLQQSRIQENPLFHAVKENDTASICKLLSSNTTDIFQKGALGETVLHIATLYSNYEAARMILDAAPELVNEMAVSELYKGETPMHIAVINQDMKLVRAMISQGADVRSPRATGTYFTRGPKNLLYFGEHILSFAACIGNEEIIRLLIQSGADIKALDTLGNTVLHVLTLQPNKTIACQVYDFIQSFDEAENGITAEMIPNKDGLTPIKLAAVEGNIVMFQHLMNKRRLIQWTFGPITNCLYNLSEIDSWGEDYSVLELVVSSKKDEALRILDLAPLQRLISLKWNKYGKYYFWILTFLYLVYIITFTLCCAYRPLKMRKGNITDPRDTTILVQRNLQEAYTGKEDHIRLVGEIVSVFGALVILLLEIPDILRFGAKRYFGKTVLGGPFHVIM
ncbi:transient receptor potential cation channel subfamily V member 5-like [Heterodontus francisci]|uniref:transient receptor potential cation channel subfamily V member 5-like n=1 Tax=Heterodontus francisci TaxID=7792 RepID=UPI00355C0B6A